MLIEEAQWFGRIIGLIGADVIYPMLNVGSSTEEFRKVDQPYIDEYLFKPSLTVS